tara:strand:- start:5334 stop:5594 length:261 start_codon:yes stop_codon:yes gene_type:complete
MNLPRRDMLVAGGPGFRVPFAAWLRVGTDIATITVGGLADSGQAKAKADLAAIGRQITCQSELVAGRRAGTCCRAAAGNEAVPFGC